MRRSRLDELARCLRGEFGPDIDWVSVIATANRHLCAPYLFRSVCSSGASSQIDPEAYQYLAELNAANRERNRHLFGQLAEVAAAMNAVGIVPLAIKGTAALAASHGGATCLRTMNDVDLLVNEWDVDVALGALFDCGLGESVGDPGPHSAGIFFRKDYVGAIDLHTALPGALGDLVTKKDLGSRSNKISISGHQVRCPDESLRFIVNLGHEMLHDQALVWGEFGLRHVLELTDLCSDASKPLDWVWIEQKCASDSRLELALEAQARLAAEVLHRQVFPLGRSTNSGWLLHQRRLTMHEYPILRRVDRAAIRRLLHLRRGLFKGFRPQ